MKNSYSNGHQNVCPLQVVSFKWLARQFSIPANAAKRILLEFVESNHDKVSATYLISGWTKSCEPQHTVYLVDARAVAEHRKKLDPMTSLHVYSVQPVQPKVMSDKLGIEADEVLKPGRGCSYLALLYAAPNLLSFLYLLLCLSLQICMGAKGQMGYVMNVYRMYPTCGTQITCRRQSCLPVWLRMAMPIAWPTIGGVL
jgi:hypothetical protein